MKERELSRDLSRLIRGELTSIDVKRMAQRAGFQSFAELCESELPEELQRIEISTRDIVTRIDRHRAGRIDLHELWHWADELYNISFNHRIAYETEQEDLILTALSVMSVICNQRLFPVRRRTARALGYLRRCLVRRKDLELRNVFERAFEELPVAHLATKASDHEEDDDDDDDDEVDDGQVLLGRPVFGPDDDDDDDELDGDSSRERWADVVLLDAPFDSEVDISSSYSWVIAFSVVTRDLFEEELVADEEDDEEDEDDEDDESADAEADAASSQAEADGRGVGGPAVAGSAETANAEAGPLARRLSDADAQRELFAVASAGASDGEDRGEPLVPGRRGRAAGTRPPVEDRVPVLKRLVPNFDFARYKPLYVSDGDGIAEVVLDAPSIGEAEVRYATKLFALANRIGGAFLNGRRVGTLAVRPVRDGEDRRGARRRRRRRGGSSERGR